MDLTPMDYVRATLANAILEGMDVNDLIEVSLDARTTEDWEEAVNLLAQTMPHQEELSGGALGVILFTERRGTDGG